MADQIHGDHADILRRLTAIETDINALSYVSPELLDAKLETIKVELGGLRADVVTLEHADQQRRTQVYAVIGALIVALVAALLQSGVFG